MLNFFRRAIGSIGDAIAAPFRDIRRALYPEDEVSQRSVTDGSSLDANDIEPNDDIVSDVQPADPDNDANDLPDFVEGATNDDNETVWEGVQWEYDKSWFGPINERAEDEGKEYIVSDYEIILDDGSVITGQIKFYGLEEDLEHAIIAKHGDIKSGRMMSVTYGA